MDLNTLINTLLKLLNNQTPKLILIDDLQNFSQSDWEELIDVSKKQGVSLVLYDRLQSLIPQLAIPEEIKTRLKQSYLAATGRNMGMLHHTQKILQAFQAKDIKVFCLKGIYLVETIYPSIGLRTFGDLDLLVKKEALSEALLCMQELGYQTSTYYNVWDKNQDIKHIPPMTKPDGPPVEIHWTILEEYEPFAIDAEGLWQRAIPARIAGVDVWALGVEDLILHLCIHMTYQHRLQAGLRNLIDIDLVLRKFQNQVNWDVLIGIARQWGVERIIALTFILLEDILGFAVPASVLEQLLGEPIDPNIIIEAKRQLLDHAGGDIQMTPDLAELVTSKSILKKIKLIWTRIFIPKSSLARLYDISPRSFKIYTSYLRRAVELFRQYGGSVLNTGKSKKSLTSSAENERALSRLREWMVR